MAFFAQQHYSMTTEISNSDPAHPITTNPLAQLRAARRKPIAAIITFVHQLHAIRRDGKVCARSQECVCARPRARRHGSARIVRAAQWIDPSGAPSSKSNDRIAQRLGSERCACVGPDAAVVIIAVVELVIAILFVEKALNGQKARVCTRGVFGIDWWCAHHVPVARGLCARLCEIPSSMWSCAARAAASGESGPPRQGASPDPDAARGPSPRVPLPLRRPAA